MIGLEPGIIHKPTGEGDVIQVQKVEYKYHPEAPTQHLFVLIPHSPIVFHATSSTFGYGDYRNGFQNLRRSLQTYLSCSICRPRYSPPGDCQQDQSPFLQEERLFDPRALTGSFSPRDGCHRRLFPGEVSHGSSAGLGTGTLEQSFLFGLFLGAIAKIVGLSNSLSYVSPPKSARNTCTM